MNHRFARAVRAHEPVDLRWLLLPALGWASVLLAVGWLALSVVPTDQEASATPPPALEEPQGAPPPAFTGA